MLVKINGEDIYYEYEYEPNKPTVVFIHGVGGKAKTVVSYWQLKNRKYNLLSFDLPGRGKSSFWKAIDNKVWLDCIVELLKTLKIDNFYILAHSYGCYLGAELINLKKFNILKSLFIAPYNPFVLETDFIRAELEKVYPKEVLSISKLTPNLIEKLHDFYVKVDPAAIMRFWIYDFSGYVKNLGILAKFVDQKFHDVDMYNAYQNACNYHIIAGADDFVVPFASVQTLVDKFNKPLTLLIGGHDLIEENQILTINDYLNSFIN